MATQDNWRWCHQCQGMFFAGGPSPHRGVCPGTGILGAFEGEHSFDNSGNYQLEVDTPDDTGQNDWHYCFKCAGLFFAGNDPGVLTVGQCPAGGGGHDKSRSGDYRLFSSGSGQGDWWFCGKCTGLFFSGNGSMGSCPAGGPHDNSSSGQYTLIGRSTVFPVTAPHLITWQSFTWGLQDDCDRVQLLMRPNGLSFPQFFLQTDAAITATKGIKLVSDGHPEQNVFSDGANHGPLGPLAVPPDELDTARLILQKQKILLSDMYQLSSINDAQVIGQDVTFVWLQDHC